MTQEKVSLSARRAWIEIEISAPDLDEVDGRSPQGERGLKFGKRRSHPARVRRRSPQGERGLKLCLQRPAQNIRLRRSPQGERGLKYHHPDRAPGVGEVALRKESVD